MYYIASASRRKKSNLLLAISEIDISLALIMLVFTPNILRFY